MVRKLDFAEEIHGDFAVYSWARSADVGPPVGE
jgi:hypothetical protein